jgi:hypothetical protein
MVIRIIIMVVMAQQQPQQPVAVQQQPQQPVAVQQPQQPVADN